MARVQLPVRIEGEDLELLKQYAKADNRPLSNYVDTVLKNQIALEKQKRGEKTIKAGKQHEPNNEAQNQPCNIYDVSNLFCPSCGHKNIALNVAKTKAKCIYCANEWAI